MADDRWAFVIKNGRFSYVKNKHKHNKEYKDKELKIMYVNKNIFSPPINKESRYDHYENSRCNRCKKLRIIVYNKNVKQRSGTKYKLYKYDKKILDTISSSRNASNISKHYSMLDLKNSGTDTPKLIVIGSDIIGRKSNYNPFDTKFRVNVVSDFIVPQCFNYFDHPMAKARIRVYRCQFGAVEESCCCSCNSDAMFEVMKNLYDCYKKKNCDHCDCILCGHKPREERRLGELRKSAAALETASVRERKKEIDKRTKEALAAMEKKQPAEKEKILKDLAMSGVPLPEGRTDSEKALMSKVRTALGLPPEPITAAEKERLKKAETTGAVIPLEGKSPAEKERTLKKQAELGIELPEGRTPSEKTLIKRIKASVLPKKRTLSEKRRKAKAAGFMTPLEGKPKEQKEKILKGLALANIPLPEGKTPSEKKLIEKVRNEVGLPPEPKNAAEKAIYEQAAAAGIITPLEEKTPKQKEEILKAQHDMGLPLPEGRTKSEKALIANIKASPRLLPSGVVIPADKLKKARAAGLFTPLANKTPEQKEKILRGLADHGIPLTEGRTASQKKLVNKVRAELGLPPEPKSETEKAKYNKAAAAGLLVPLEGKSEPEKAKLLKAQHDMGLPLPKGRTSSEKALIAKVKAMPRAKATPSDRLKTAKAAGLLTPLEGKPPEKKEKILRGLAMAGIPLPEGKTPSDKKLINQVRTDIGLPPEPKTAAEKEKYNKAIAAGIIEPLEEKSYPEKNQILKAQHDMGIPLPEGRTASEKALIAKIKASPRGVPSGIPSEKLRKAKAAGLLTPLTGKTPEQKEKILRGLAMNSIPLPEGRTPSDKKLINKVRADLGLPPEPKTDAEREKLNKAITAGIVEPLEERSGPEKEKTLKAQHVLGIPLPEGRTPSEKALINKIKESPRGILSRIPSEKLRKAKEAGLLTPFTGKTPEQREKILRGLAMNGIPLPEGKTPSDKKIINKVRADLGLPPEPKTDAEREKLDKAIRDGIVEPLEERTAPMKEKTLKAQHVLGIPLPEGRTPSEKALIAKIKASPTGAASGIPSEKLRKAKAAGLLTPLTGKTPEQKEKILRGLAMNGVPLPEGKTPSDKNLLSKVRADLGLPPEPKTDAEREKLNKAIRDGIVEPLEERTGPVKEKTLKAQHVLGIPLPEGRTPSEKALIAKIKASPRGVASGIPSEKLRKAKAAGLLTPLTGKTPEQKEKILRGLAMNGIPLPEGKTNSDKNLLNKVRADLGLPPEPKTAAERDKLNKAITAGIVEPLEERSGPVKEKTLQAQHVLGIPLPDGRTPSEKALIAKIKASPRGVPSGMPSEKLRKAKAAGLLTPLTGKTPSQKEKILRGLAMNGIPIPEGKTPSDKKIISKVRADLGLPPEPKTAAERDKLNKAIAAGIVEPLEERSLPEKEKALKAQHVLGIPLPEGRSPSEKALIAKIKASPRVIPSGIPTDKLRKAKAAGLLTPLTGKTPVQKEKILRALAMNGIPLPEGRTPSDKKLLSKVRADLGLPPEPKTDAEREKLNKAIRDGIVEPLEERTAPVKEKTLKAQHVLGIPLPEGRTPSEKALIAKIKASPRGVASGIPSEKLRKAKAAGLLTPLTGKTPEQKEKILRGLAMNGIPLPEGKTNSDKNLLNKVRADLGLPPEPKTAAERDKLNKAITAGIVEPLEERSGPVKEKTLKAQHVLGIPLPEGRTPSEKALIAKIKASPIGVPSGIPSEKLRKAKAAGLLTPLTGKTPIQKEKILRGLAMNGIPLPEGKTPSDKKIINKVRADLGLPPEPKTDAEREKLNKAIRDGIVEPLEERTGPVKEKTLKAQHVLGIPLPEGRTPSEKALIAKIKASPRGVPSGMPSEKLRKAKAAGLLTPLTGKTPIQKEKILRGLAMNGIPLPEGKTPSDKKLLSKVRADLGLPPEPKTDSEREKLNKAIRDGIVEPLEERTGPVKEKTLKAQHVLGIPLPEGRTPSEKALIAKIKASPRGVPSGIPSEKLRKAKAAGLLTPLTGKTPEQKEKILRGLAMNGIPLPEGKTPSDKILVNKVRADLGLPPEPKTAAEREKLNKAIRDGIVEPLEERTGPVKEKTLKAQHVLGIPLPAGRTPSEKALIAKIKALPRGVPSGMPSEKLRKAKAAGLFTPLTGKTPKQKEKILRDLAMNGIPLPEGTTHSEKKLISKVRADLGLPPEPKTAAERDKLNKAIAAGMVVPLEERSRPDKEKTLKTQHALDIPLPEGRTPSEKALIAKIKASPRGVPSGIASEKLKKAKAAGLFTPLTGKTPIQKEKILRGLAMNGIPLPEGKTPSDKKLINKVRADLGLPPEPKTAAEREKLNKAIAAGMVVPLEERSRPDKEKTLKTQHALDIPLPEGRTPSEKALIAKIKASPRGVPSGIASEKLKKAKAAGLFTPLTGKTPIQKEKILRGLAMNGIPLPEGKTPSDKKLIHKVRADLGLPPEPKTAAEREKLNKAIAAGMVVPLEERSRPDKEKTLKTQHALDIPLPEGRTPSEKALIAKIKASPRGVPSGIASEKLRKAYAAGLFTPLIGKTPEQKEKILRGLAMNSIPLPEGKTPSDKKLINKVRADLGLPPEPKTAAERDKLNKAIAAGMVVPLEERSRPDKEKTLKTQHALDIPLPEGRTPSEKSLIAKIKASPKGVPSEKLKKAKAAGLLTPLTGKTPEQKENIIRGLAAAGLPIPEGTTASEKDLVKKIRTDMGIPPEATPSEKKRGFIKRKKPEFGVEPQAFTPSEKAIVKKAKADGLITPLTGKTPAQKEKVIKGLAQAGLPIPEGKTQSEKDLIKKIRRSIGFPPEATASEKRGKIRTKSRKVGAKRGEQAQGVTEKFEDIIKTTTCDRGCGCDKKKIRFKHSYVKIRVTSPDISSLCSCPEECIPGVIGGVFVDNEGIKVTVGSAVGFRSFPIDSSHIDKAKSHFANDEFLGSLKEVVKKSSNKRHLRGQDIDVEFLLSCNKNFTTTSDETISESSECDYKNCYTSPVHGESYVSIKRFETETTESYDNFYFICSECSTSQPSQNSIFSSRSSNNSVVIVKTDSSLSLETNSLAEGDTISLTSLVDSILLSNASHYLVSEHNTCSDITVEKSDLITDSLYYDSSGTLKSFVQSDSMRQMHRSNVEERKNDGFIFRLSYTDVSKEDTKTSNSPDKKNQLVVQTRDSETDHSFIDIVNELLLQKKFSEDSSVYLIIPTSDEYNSETSVDSAHSTLCIQISENISKWDRNMIYGEDTSGIKISTIGKKRNIMNKIDKLIDGRNVLQLDTEEKKKFKTLYKRKESLLLKPIKELKAVSVDTMRDRPCCCIPKEQSTKHAGIQESVISVASELISPIIAKQGAAQGLQKEVYGNWSSKSLTLSQHKEYLSNENTSVSMLRVPASENSSFHSHTNLSPKIYLTNSHQQSVEIGLHQQVKRVNRMPHSQFETSVQQSNIGVQASGLPRHRHIRSVLKQQNSKPVISYHTTPCKRSNRHQCVDNIGTQVSAIPYEEWCRIADNCNCDPNKLKELFEKLAREISSRNCGGSNSKISRNPPCSKGVADTDTHRQEPKKGTCFCDENTPKKMKIKRKKQCPCQRIAPHESKACQCCSCKGKSKLKCDCNGKKKKICECPPPPPPPPEPVPMEVPNELSQLNELNTLLDYEKLKYFKQEFDLLDQEGLKEELKIKSDMTQTTSGFRFKFKKRFPQRRQPYMDSWTGETDMSFEDAIKYFEEHPIEVPCAEEPVEEYPPEEACKCDGQPPPPRRSGTQRAGGDSEKTFGGIGGTVGIRGTGGIGGIEGYAGIGGIGAIGATGGISGISGQNTGSAEETEGTDEVVEPDLKGFKLVIGGKGSASKGLSGILCFDLAKIQSERETSSK